MSADTEEVESRCKDLLEHVKALDPTLLQRPKFHLLLHLADNIRDFGPTAGYNTERYDNTYSVHHKITNIIRCEAFNRIMRSYNIYGNRHSSSRDIAITIEHLRFLSDGGLIAGSKLVIVVYNCYH